MSNFKIQIPQEIVRDKNYTEKEFILLLKLIQCYYRIPEKEKSLTFAVRHKDLMFYSGFKDNDTFKKALKGLNERGAIVNEIKSLPRTSGLEIILNEEVIPEKNNKEGYFVQLSSDVLNKNIIDAVGHTGIRLLYYYQSYINTKTKKYYCYVAESTTAKDLGITEKTVIKYNKLLKKHKLLKIEVHKIEQDYYTAKKGNESYLFTKFNNHYYIRYENINNFGRKSL